MKRLILVYLFTISLFGCHAVDIENMLNGVWTEYTLEQKESAEEDKREFAWGTGDLPLNEFIAIDVSNDKPFVYIGGLGIFKVVEYELEGDDVRFVFYFDRADVNIEYILHFVENDVFWIENRSPLSWHNRGEEGYFYKTSGPQFQDNE